MTETSWQKGDLATVCGHGTTLYVVTDAGMGKPRGNMRLSAVDGPRKFRNTSEGILSRPPLRRGIWARCVRSDHHSRLHRVINVGKEDLTFDLARYPDGSCAEVFTSAHPKFWVPVATPEFTEPPKLGPQDLAYLQRVNAGLRKTIEDLKTKNDEIYAEGGRYHAEVHDLRIRLKEALRDKEQSEITFQCVQNEVIRLSEENANLKRTVGAHDAGMETLQEEVERFRCEADDERNAKVNAISDCNGKLREIKSDLEFMRALLKNERKDKEDALNAHKGALGQRDREREGKWEAQEQLRTLQEIYAAKCKENEILASLYEARVRQAKQRRKEIVM